jgi:hypothetical protein
MTRAYCSSLVLLLQFIVLNRVYSYVSLIFDRYFSESVHGSWRADSDNQRQKVENTMAI